MTMISVLFFIVCSTLAPKSLAQDLTYGQTFTEDSEKLSESLPPLDLKSKQELSEKLRATIRVKNLVQSMRLVHEGADPLDHDHEGNSAETLARAKGFNHFCNWMNLHWVNEEDATARGWTPLFYALAKGSLLKAAALVTAGASPNHREKVLGQSPLEYSMMISSLCMIRVLIKAGASLEGHDFLGNTAIMYGADFNSARKIELVLPILLPNLSLLLAKNFNGESAAHFAAQARNLEALALFALLELQLTEPDLSGTQPNFYLGDGGESIISCIESQAKSNLGFRDEYILQRMAKRIAQKCHQ